MNDNQKLINGRTIAVGKMPATKAVQVQVALVSLCGEALFKASTTNKDDKEAMGAAVLSALSSRLDSKVLLDAMHLTLIDHVSIDGNRIQNLDAAFADHVEDMWPVMFFALKVNFARFFQGDLFSSLMKKAEGLNPSSQQTSTGTSQDQ